MKRFVRPSQFLMRLSRGDVVLAGYIAMGVALILSAVEAQQIYQNASEHAAAIYHRHLKEEEILDRVHTLFTEGCIDARDFLLSRRPDRVAVFNSQLAGLRRESQKAMAELDQMPGFQPSSRLRAMVQEFWDLIEPIAGWSDAVREAKGYEFVQQVIVPRLNAAGDLVRELAQANQRALESKEVEFARSRDSAAIQLFIILVISLLFGYAAAYFSLARSKKLESETVRQYVQLIRAKRDLEQLSVRLLEVQEDERKRISRELHDEIGQTVTALRIEISNAQSLCKTRAPEVQERLERARSLADKTVATVRNISLLLRPSLLDDLGLGPALQWLAEDFTRRTGIPCDFSEEGLQENLSDACRTCVYRIVQEALHNCAAHAAASKVRISIRQSRERLTMEIEDDGRGFELNESGTPRRSSGLGLLGMRERAAALEGALSIRSRPGEGTRITVSLPIRHAGPDRVRPEGRKEVHV
jgi:signal transduction histidine kinase